MDIKEQLASIRTDTEARLATVRTQAQNRLLELRSEMEDIYAAFPDLRPTIARTRCRTRYVREGLHWTQRPENREKLQAQLRKMNDAARVKLAQDEPVTKAS